VSKCWSSPTGRHEWKAISLVVQGVYATPTTCAQLQEWPHVQCTHCGTTSYRDWKGRIVADIPYCPNCGTEIEI
jgi:hypothetical protein